MPQPDPRRVSADPPSAQARPRPGQTLAASLPPGVQVPAEIQPGSPASRSVDSAPPVGGSATRARAQQPLLSLPPVALDALAEARAAMPSAVPSGLAPATLAPGRWSLDATSSRAGFRLRKLGLVQVDGAVPVVSGYLQVGPEGLPDIAVHAELDATRFCTGNAARDEAARSSCLLSVQAHPRWTFDADRLELADGGARGTLIGRLTVRGVTSPVTLSVSLDRVGPTELNVSANGRLDRRDFGVTAWPGLVAGTVDVQLAVTLRR